MADEQSQHVKQSASLPKRFLHFLFWSVLFGVSYTQAPLYYSNQNQYFLHGLAAGGWGNLDQDWLVNTRDPTPIFSAIVGGTGRFLHESFFYVYYLALLGVYFHSLVGVWTFLRSDGVYPRRDEPGGSPEHPPNSYTWLLFVTLFIALHAGLVRLASARLTGIDYPWYLQAGVAGQYLLGFGLQPSVCGVFLLASILAFVRGRPWRAVLLACLAGTLHTTYLLGAAFVTLAYMILLFRREGWKKALALGFFSLALVMPVVIYNVISFAPTTADGFAKAQHILAHFRIPHHAEPERWFDGIALAQVLWIVVAIALVRQTPLLFIMGIPFVLSLLLTLVQIVTENDTLALLFPWRTSAFLVPLATTILLGRLVLLLAPRLERPANQQCLGLKLTCAACLAVLAAGGLAIPIFEWGFRTNPDELPTLEFVRANKQRGDVYLLPVDWPKTTRKGAASTNFTPAPRAGKTGDLIAIDLQRFRLTTGAAIYVDFKSIPYKDEEVLEWHRRLHWARALYKKREWSEQDLAELTREGITHVVTTTAEELHAAGLERVYADPDTNYRIYRVRQNTKK